MSGSVNMSKSLTENPNYTSLTMSQDNIIDTIKHLTLSIKSNGGHHRETLNSLLEAYTLVNLNYFNSDKIKAAPPEINTNEVLRIAKVVQKKGQKWLYERMLALAESELIDIGFLGSQLRKQYESSYEVAFDFYTHHHQRLKPNVYFNPKYYTASNQLDSNVDPVFHYLESSDKCKLQVHRLFCMEWLEQQAPDIRHSNCPVGFYWKHCYPNKIAACSPDKATASSIIKELFFLEVSLPFLSKVSEIKKIEHQYSNNESMRLLLDFFKLNQGAPRFIPIDFNPDEYLELHFDLLKRYRDKPIDSLGHYLLHGIHEERVYSVNEWHSYQRKEPKKFEASIIDFHTDKKPLCVLTHLYYVDLWEELKEYIDNIDVDFDLHVNLVDSTWTNTVIEVIRKDYPNAIIKISPNEGRDIGGYFSLLKTINIDDYLAFVTIHSKKSQHISESMLIYWRTNLLQALLGSKEVVRNNLAAFIEDHTIGIIGSALHRDDTIGQNEVLLEQLLDLYKISKENRDCEYVSGTMMMLRSDIMKRVYEVAKNLSFNNADNKGLDFLIDGQLEHGLERIFGNVMKEMGYKFYWS